jgi:Photosynthesis system II assembly factor YCF48
LKPVIPIVEPVNRMPSMSKAQLESANKPDSSQQRTYQASAVSVEKATPGISARKAAPAQPVSAFANAPMASALPTKPSVGVARPYWHINALGQPERSYGYGEWQPLLLNEKSKMRAISVFNEEVWIGGKNSRLYHSTDNGASWIQIALPEKNGREHSISHIHFQTAQSCTIESDDRTVWITSDGGSMWK